MRREGGNFVETKNEDDKKTKDGMKTNHRFERQERGNGERERDKYGDCIIAGRSRQPEFYLVRHHAAAAI